jgi:LysM repeat protein
VVKFFQFLLLCILLVPAQRANSAPLQSASELIAEVNALRASQGLQAYQTDLGLMSYAQQHAEYCASLGHGTHQHSDGTYPSDVGLVENVASGTEGFLTLDLVVYTIWSDWGHMKTMVGYTNGQVGAGMAVKDGTIYYVLNVRGGEEADYPTLEPTVTGSPTADGTPPTQAPTSDSAMTATPADYTFEPILTNTPQADGSIVHIVQAGETLWSIALSYGVKVEELRWLNGLPSDSNDIYVEQRLLIRPGYTETPTGQVTDTPRPTRVRATLTATPRPSQTITQTLTPTEVLGTPPTQTPVTPYISTLDFKSLGIGVLVGILILVAVGLNEFRRARNR